MKIEKLKSITILTLSLILLVSISINLYQPQAKATPNVYSVAAYFGTQDFDEKYDLNSDNKIDIQDVAIAAKQGDSQPSMPLDPLEAWSESELIIWQYNSTFYATRNMSTLLVQELASNLTRVEENALGNMTSGLLYLKEVQHNSSLSIENDEIIIEAYQGAHKIYSNQGKFLLPQLASDPDTTGWDSSESGQIWFNTGEGRYKFWDSTQILVLPGQGGTGATGNYTLPYTFTIYLNGSTAKAEDRYGNVVSSNTDHDTVINYAFDNLPSGEGTVFLTRGDYQINNDLSMTARTHFIGEGPASSFLNVTANLSLAALIIENASDEYDWSIENIGIGLSNAYNGHGIYSAHATTSKQRPGAVMQHILVNRTKLGYSGIWLYDVSKAYFNHLVVRAFGNAVKFTNNAAYSFNWGDSLAQMWQLQPMGDGATGLEIISTAFSGGQAANIFKFDHIMVYSVSTLANVVSINITDTQYLTFSNIHVEHGAYALVLNDVRYSAFYNTQILDSTSGGIGIYVTDSSRDNLFSGGYVHSDGYELQDDSTVASPMQNVYRDMYFGTSPSLSLGKNAAIFNSMGYNPVGLIGSPVSTTYLVDSGSGAIANDTAYTITNSPKQIYVATDGTMLRTLIDGNAVFTTEEGFMLTLQPRQTVEFEWSAPPTITVIGE